MRTRLSLQEAAVALLIILAGYLAYLYFQPVPAIVPVKNIIVVPQTQPAALPWPAAGQAAIGAAGYGLLDSHNDTSPVPIASIAKIITALAILQKKPLASGDSGPVITFGNSDVAIYNDYVAKGGSVAPVSVGEQLSELQALEAMLLPSANNVADSMASWAFGSVQDYVVYANNMVKSMGLSHTTVGDASGFGDNTTSTASDLVRLGIAALDQPALASTVNKSSALLPVTGKINNTNWLLGQDGVVGVKTGNTDKAGGCYLFASQQNISGHQTLIIGSLLDQPDLQTAISAAPSLINGAVTNFVPETIVHKGQAVAIYKTSWGSTASAVAAKDISILAWKGQPVRLLNDTQTLKTPAVQGSSAGNLDVSEGQQQNSVQLILNESLASPSWHWRLIRH